MKYNMESKNTSYLCIQTYPSNISIDQTARTMMAYLSYQNGRDKNIAELVYCSVRCINTFGTGTTYLFMLRRY